MKRETLRHPKTMDLASRLNIPTPFAIGLLQLLWDFTADYALAGDVGKHADGAIARACQWDGEPGLFIVALIESGWVDEDESHRLVIHDWAQHCENWVRAKAQKAGIELMGRLKTASYDPDLRGDLKSGSFPRDQSYPNQTNLNLSQPNLESSPEATEPDAGEEPETSPKKPGRSRRESAELTDVAIPASLDSPEFRASLAEWWEFRRAAKKPISELAAKKLINQLEGWGQARAIAAINFSITNDYTGCFEPSSNKAGSNGTYRTQNNGKQSSGRYNPAAPVVNDF